MIAEGVEVGNNMSDIAFIKDDFSRKVPKLMYLGSEPRPYGINERDMFNMDGHLAAVLANGLRMLIAYGHHVIDEEEYERIASKLEFYADDYNSALHSAIDWSSDKPERDMLEWVNSDDRSPWPGMNEYSQKSAQIDYWRYEYMREAMDWLKEYWGELWD
jgi:hypothetical protein